MYFSGSRFNVESQYKPNLIVSLFATFFVIIKNYSIIAEKKKKAMDGESMGVPNRLISEKSPYLLQHAYNAVDWYPRGDEAFRMIRNV